jgi:hypothetical protein
MSDATGSGRWGPTAGTRGGLRRPHEFGHLLFLVTRTDAGQQNDFRTGQIVAPPIDFWEQPIGRRRFDTDDLGAGVEQGNGHAGNTETGTNVDK